MLDVIGEYLGEYLSILPVSDAKLELQLQSRRRILPLVRHQRAWARAFSPNLEYAPGAGAWTLLQRFTSPLLRELASSAHVEGYSALGLDAPIQPSIESFARETRAHTGWSLFACAHEIDAEEYFALLSKKTFPCIPKLRPARGALCGDAPDFWHEAVGHIAPLVDPKVSAFYRKCGALYSRTAERARKKELRQLEAILWILLEYGFVRASDGRDRAFGAALSGSFVALTKWKRDRWTVQDFTPERALSSGLFERGLEPKRDGKDRIIFFRFDPEHAIEQISEALAKS